MQKTITLIGSTADGYPSSANLVLDRDLYTVFSVAMELYADSFEDERGNPAPVDLRVTKSFPTPDGVVDYAFVEVVRHALDCYSDELGERAEDEVGPEILDGLQRLAILLDISRMTDRYILRGHTPVPEPDLTKWAVAFEGRNRHVAVTFIGDIRVSTVFLGLDHNFSNLLPGSVLKEYAPGIPILFETMVFGGPLDQTQERYTTWEEAEKGHDAMVERVKAELGSERNPG